MIYLYGILTFLVYYLILCTFLIFNQKYKLLVKKKIKIISFKSYLKYYVIIQGFALILYFCDGSDRSLTPTFMMPIIIMMYLTFHMLWPDGTKGDVKLNDVDIRELERRKKTERRK